MGKALYFAKTYGYNNKFRQDIKISPANYQPIQKDVDIYIETIDCM